MITLKMNIHTALTQMISVIENDQIYISYSKIISYHIQFNLLVNDQAYFDAFFVSAEVFHLRIMLRT